LEWRFELLARELDHLRSENGRLLDLCRWKDQVLADEALFLEDVLNSGQPVTIEGLRRRVSRLRGTVDREKGGVL